MSDDSSLSYIKDSVKKILSYFSNTDFNIKIIINKVNSLEEKIDLLIENKEVTKKTFEDSRVLKKSIPDTPQAPKDKPLSALGIKVTSDSGLVDTLPEYDSLSAVTGNTKSKNVFQKILHKDGKPIYMADIKITDDSGKVIKQTRTNPKGRWMGSIPPGDYTIHVVKNFDQGSHPGIDLKFKVNIPATEQTDFELDPPSIPDTY